MESRFQLLLQLFIVFTRADRAPSTVQLGAMASSVVMLAISGLNDVRRKQKTVDLGADVRRAFDLLPGILATKVSKIECIFVPFSFVFYTSQIRDMFVFFIFLFQVSQIGYMALLATLLRCWMLLLLVLYIR